MTRQQRIWTEIAEAFGTPPRLRDQRQATLARAGLCYAWKMATGDSIMYDTLSVVLARDTGLSAVSAIQHDARDGPRATLAGLLAAMTDAERDEILTRRPR